MKKINRLACLLILAAFAATVLPQSGATYVITQSVISNGGGNAGGGTFGLTGTTGQSVAGGALSGSAFAVTSGFWNFTPAVDSGQGLEGDVAGRPSGNGSVEANDVNQVKRFFIGLDMPYQSNEFQRADSAPFSARGDGLLQANDINQTKRFLIGLEAQEAAAGPTSASGIQPFTAEGSVAKTSADGVQNNSTNTAKAAPAAPRELRVESISAGAGQAVTINILVDALGDESGYGFRLNYDQTKLTLPSTTIGTAGGSRFCNTAIPGQITCSVDSFPNDQPGSSTDQIGEIGAGNNQTLLRANFTVAAIAPPGVSPLTLTNVSATNDASAGLTITSQNGTLTITGPSAASVGVSGRALTAQNGGIANVRVTLTDQTGTTRQALTGPFGYFRFDDVEAGQTYIISIRSKRYQFANPTQVLFVGDEITNLDFTALP